MFTPSFASTAWCSPSDQRRPGIRRPVNSSTMMTSPSFTTYSTSRLYERVRLDRRLDVVLQVPVLRVGDVADAQQPSIFSQPSSVTVMVLRFSSTT